MSNVMNRICMFDTETVGIYPNYIISLAYRYYEKGKPMVSGIIECNPNYPISPEATAVNGYTNDNVVSFPFFIEHWKTIEPYFRDSVWVCHNTPFDTKALRLELKRYCLPEPHHYTLDTLSMARSILTKKEIENYKLITLCKHYNIINDDSDINFHAADFDIWATDKLFRKFRELSKKDSDIANLFIPKEIEGEYTECDPPDKFCDDYSY